MTLLQLSVRNAGRSPGRTGLTILAVALTVVAFLLLRSLSAGWTRQVEETPDNRVVARHKVGWSQSLPVHYVEQVRRLPGVKHAMGGSWAELRYPRDERVSMMTIAVHVEPFVAMHYELEAPEEQKAAWIATRSGVAVSRELADELGWRVGDTIHMRGAGFAGELPLQVASIVQSSRHGFGHRNLWLHWEYLNEHLPERARDRINIVAAEIHDPKQGANIARAVDILFDSQDDQTLTQEDQALNASFVGMFGGFLDAIDVVSSVVMLIVLLLVGNTLSMSVRERTSEYGVLKALGFRARHLTAFVLGEAGLLGLAGGALGVALSFPAVELAATRYVEEQMRMAPLHVPTASVLLALLGSVVLGLSSAMLPARSIARLPVTEALRHVG